MATVFILPASSKKQDLSIAFLAMVVGPDTFVKISGRDLCGGCGQTDETDYSTEFFLVF